MDLGILDSIPYLTPELILLATALSVWVVDRLARRGNESLGEIALLGAAASVYAAQRLAGWGEGWILERFLVIDGFAVFCKVLIGLATVTVIWMSLESRTGRANPGTLYGLLLGAAVALELVSAAANLATVYLALEVTSLASYFAIPSRDARFGDAARGHLVWGGVASAMMLCAMSWIHGRTGSLDAVEIRTALLAAPGEDAAAVLLAIVVALSGAGLKVVALPFELWAEDADGSPTVPLVAFVAIAAKAALASLAIRFLGMALTLPATEVWSEVPGASWPPVIVFVGMVALTLGSLAALRETSLKRLLACASIAQGGIVFLAAALPRDEGLRAMLLCLVADFVTSAGAFLAILAIREVTRGDDLESCRALVARGGTFLAATTAVLLLSLVGLPPFLGFVAKLYVFTALVRQGLYELAGLGVLGVLALLYSCGRIVHLMLLAPAEDEAPVPAVGAYNRALLGVLAFASIAFGVWWSPLFGLVEKSVRLFQG